jgi:hypothetical protein
VTALATEQSLTPQVDLAALEGLFNVEGRRVFIPGGYGAIGRPSPEISRDARRGRRWSVSRRRPCGPGDTAALSP